MPSWVELGREAGRRVGLPDIEYQACLRQGSLMLQVQVEGMWHPIHDENMTF